MNQEVTAMENIVQDHERRITELEKQAVETKNQYLRLENTVLQGNQRQEDLLNKVLDHALKLNEKDSDNKHDLKKTRMLSRKDILITIFGGGGILGSAFALVQHFLTK